MVEGPRVLKRDHMIRGWNMDHNQRGSNNRTKTKVNEVSEKKCAENKTKRNKFGGVSTENRTKEI